MATGIVDANKYLAKPDKAEQENAEANKNTAVNAETTEESEKENLSSYSINNSNYGKEFKSGSYKYKTFNPTESEAYVNTMNKLAELEKATPTFSTIYDVDLEKIYDKILNRDKFHYDINSDALYQQYRDQYVQQGQNAMRDTMGRAAALTGGYGSSYGQNVGQQAYNSYLQNLNDIVPELYDRAYQQYQDEGNALQNQYALASDMYNRDYGEYRDNLNQWNADRDYYTDLANYLYEQGYSDWWNRWNAGGELRNSLGEAVPVSGGGYSPKPYYGGGRGGGTTLTIKEADKLAKEMISQGLTPDFTGVKVVASNGARISSADMNKAVAKTKNMPRTVMKRH